MGRTNALAITEYFTCIRYFAPVCSHDPFRDDGSTRTEYVKFAWAKGLSKKRIWIVHAFKNTLLPVITVGGVQIGIMVAYTILTETVFQWPGMGFMFLEAINRVDTPLIVAYLIIVGLIFVITNTIVDILYGLVNPMVN